MERTTQNAAGLHSAPSRKAKCFAKYLEIACGESFPRYITHLSHDLGGGGDYRSFSRSKHKKPPKFFHPMRFLNLQFMGRPDKEHNFRNYLYLATGSQVLIQPSHTGNKNRTPNTLSFCVYYISDYHSCRSIHRPGCLHLMEPSASTSQPPPPPPH